MWTVSSNRFLFSGFTAAQTSSLSMDDKKFIITWCFLGNLRHKDLVYTNWSKQQVLDFEISFYCIRSYIICVVCLTNRFLVIMHLLQNRSHDVKMWWNQKRHTRQTWSVTDVLTTFWYLLWSITKQTDGNMESIYFTHMIIKKQKQKLMMSSICLFTYKWP